VRTTAKLKEEDKDGRQIGKIRGLIHNTLKAVTDYNDSNA
jgi:hypothetical protein